MSDWTTNRGKLTPAGVRLRAEIERGGNDTQVAERLGICPKVVRRHRRAMGVPNPWKEGVR